MKTEYFLQTALDNKNTQHFINKYVYWGYVSRDTSPIMRQCLSLPNDWRGIPQNVASLNMLTHNVINVLGYKHGTDNWQYVYV